MTNVERAERTQRSVHAQQRVLVVEDQYLLAGLICRQVRDAGGEVMGPAGSLGDAQRLLRTARPDAAVLNFRLNGDTTAELARTLLSTGCRVLFVSALAERAEIPEDLRSCRWLDKPDLGDRLRNELEQLLRFTGPEETQ